MTPDSNEAGSALKSDTSSDMQYVSVFQRTALLNRHLACQGQRFSRQLLI